MAPALDPPGEDLGVISLYAVLGVWAAEVRIRPQYTGWVIATVIAGAVLLAAHRVLAWHLGRFVITNKRLMATEGVFFRRVGMIPLLRVTDMRYVQSPLGRVLDYGTFHLESASRANVLRRIVDLPSPNELYLRLVEEMYEPDAVEARLDYRDDEELHDASDIEFAFDEEAGPPTRLLDDGRARAGADPLDPAALRREVILRVADLSDQLGALTDAIRRLDATPAGTVAAAETSRPTPPEDRPGAEDGPYADEPRRVAPAGGRRVGGGVRRRPSRAEPLPETGD